MALAQVSCPSSWSFRRPPSWVPLLHTHYRCLLARMDPLTPARAALRLLRSMNAGLHSRAGLPRSRTHPLWTVPSPHTSRPHAVAFARYPSARRAHGCPVSDFTTDQQARRGHQAESRSLSYGPVHPHRLLPTPSRGGAVTAGFGPESVCPERTCTSLDACASRRTGRRAKHADSRDVRKRKYKPLIAASAVCICVLVTSRQAAFGGPSNGHTLFVIFVCFVVKTETPFVSVPPFLL